MKLVKIKLKKVRTPEHTSFTYPPEWVKEKINVLAFEDSETLGPVEESCIAIIHDDEYAAQLLQSPDVAEIDETGANDFGRRFKPQRLLIDQDKLPEILLAMDKGEARRTMNERDMLNPDHPEQGIRKTRLFDVRHWYPATGQS